MWSKSIVTHQSEAPYRELGYSIYIAEQPFRVWVRYRGETGDRVDRNDEIVEAREISTVEELTQILSSIK